MSRVVRWWLQWWGHSRRGLLAVALLMVSCATLAPQVLATQVSPKGVSEQTIGPDQVWQQPDWRRTFGTPELSGLIEKALAANRDLALAVAHVMEAPAKTTIRRAALLPQINAQAKVLRSSSGQSGQSIGRHFDGALVTEHIRRLL